MSIYGTFLDTKKKHQPFPKENERKIVRNLILFAKKCKRVFSD